MENSNENILEEVTFDTKLSKMTLENLKRSAPWMTFLSIMGFILCGFMGLSALGILSAGNMFGVGFGAGIAFFYLILTAIVFFLNKYLFDYASNIKNFFRTNDEVSLEKAFEMQKKYWIYKGILIIVYLSFIVLAMIFFAIGAVMAPSFF